LPFPIEANAVPDRRTFLKWITAGAASPFLASCDRQPGYKISQKARNILFISIDDLNDWVGVLGGHPDVQTPNLDAFAKDSLLFTNAHCPAPLCNASRVATLTGVRPSTSGVYFNYQRFRESDYLKSAKTIPGFFRKQGYHCEGAGKILHHEPDEISWDAYHPSLHKNLFPHPIIEKRLPDTGMPKWQNGFDWHPLQTDDTSMSDAKIASIISGLIGNGFTKPTFLGCGIYRPHLPWYVPQHYFDQYPLDSITLPNVKQDDQDDLPVIARQLTKETRHRLIIKNKLWKQAVQGYLASISFADKHFGTVVQALKASPHWEDTIVVLWSDHGWHLGEKLHWTKYALWERATRVPLMIRVPGSINNGKTCDAPVNLIDIFPTLSDLCGFEANPLAEGSSLLPLLEYPLTKHDTPSLSTYGKNNHAVRSRQWRYIRYHDGTEELYSHLNDPNEWDNLALDPEYNDIKQKLQSFLPTVNAENSPISNNGLKAYKDYLRRFNLD
jgi:arylsulfatase A-like enzyme